MDTSDYIAIGLYILGVVHSYWDYRDNLEIYSFAADEPELRNWGWIHRISCIIVSLLWPLYAVITIFTDALGLRKTKYRYRARMEEVERKRKLKPTDSLDKTNATDIDWV